MFLILFCVYLSNSIYSQETGSKQGQESQKNEADGAVRFYFVDSVKEEITYINCTITYGDNIKVNRLINPATSDNIIFMKEGKYTFHIKTRDYKDVVVSDVQVWSNKRTQLNIKLTPKTSKTDTDTIKIKWVSPQIDNSIKQGNDGEQKNSNKKKKQ